MAKVKDAKVEVVNEYFLKFGDFPPLLMMMSYEHPIYQKLMKNALKTGIAVTADDIEKEINEYDIKYDMD